MGLYREKRTKQSADTNYKYKIQFNIVNSYREIPVVSEFVHALGEPGDDYDENEEDEEDIMYPQMDI